jgi:hypothetical protein
VRVVDAVEVIVLIVPAEGREEHAHIEPRHVHPRDAGLEVLEQGAVHARKQVQVPAAAAVVAAVVEDTASSSSLYCSSSSSLVGKGLYSCAARVVVRGVRCSRLHIAETMRCDAIYSKHTCDITSAFDGSHIYTGTATCTSQ